MAYPVEGGPRLRRSVLITPGDNDTLLSKAAASRADVSVIDWEDGVYESRKAAARSITAGALEAYNWRGRELAIRINAIDSPFGVEDLRAAAGLPVAGVRIPKSTGSSDIVRAAELLDAIEPEVRPPGLAPLEIWVSIETSRALLEVEEIARCTPRMTAISIGEGDLGVSLGVKRLQLGPDRWFGPIRYEYLYAESRVVAAARAYGLDPINTGYTAFGDLEGTRAQALFGAQMGFSGCVLFSPKQVDVVNDAYSPSAEDLEWARVVVEDFERSTTERQRTVIVARNEMIDGPYVQNAQRLLARDEQCRAAAAAIAAAAT